MGKDNVALNIRNVPQLFINIPYRKKKMSDLFFVRQIIRQKIGLKFVFVTHYVCKCISTKHLRQKFNLAKYIVGQNFRQTKFRTNKSDIFLSDKVSSNLVILL